jgi:Family of unknown function (DUF6520)
MKRTRVALVGAFLLAVGSAFVTKASVRPYNAGYTQTSTDCTAVATDCNTTGTFTCSIVVYKDQGTPSTTCINLLTKQNHP